ncbi:MAG TPA: amino acid adenylation domain-containing protein, partial [Longimicrobiaceae bacterium]
MSALYGAFSRGEASPLAELPVQYADYAVWQREWLRGAVLEEQLGYWRRRLAGAPPLLEVPTDRPRAVKQDPRAASHAFALSGGLSEELRALSRREGTTLFMTLLGAWQALLGRYSGQEDVVVGSPVAGRGQVETEGLIGFFVNMLALRGDLGGDPTWTELLGRVRETALGAYTHQEVPFERLVEEVVTERSLTHAPLFQVTFALDRTGGGGAPSLGDLAVDPFGGGEGVSKFDLDLTFVDGGGPLGAEITCVAALFEAETIARMAGHLEATLQAMAARAGARLSELSLLSGAERTQVLRTWNPAAAPAPQRCVHELFAGQAARTPHAVAVVCGGDALTFAGLADRAERLARALRREGVEPERVVGIFMENSVDTVCALLATLQAGGCCLLLDPEHPVSRLAYLLEDAGVDVAVAQPHLAGRLLGARAGLRVLEPLPDSPAGAREAPLPRVPLESAAYLVYTSGSTGRPKGVLVPHSAAAVHFTEMARAYPYLPGDRVLVFAAQTFDSFFEESLAPLLVGASVALRDPVVWTPAEFAARIGALGVTVADVPPAYWAQLVRERDVVLELKRRLRLMVVGGEALPAATVRAWAECGGGEVRLLNAYGPTEAVVTSTLHEAVEGHGAAWGASVPIGRPVGGRAAYVLDTRGEPVPVGVPGELYLGGPALARGYLGRAELTAEKFVPDGFGPAGGRQYRTGDRVRWRTSGELEYLGRIDQQVKVRGVRIEPGEVEAALLEQARVREAVVVVREDVPGERRLVGYVVPGAGAEVSASELRAHLRERLPEQLVPGAFVVMEGLPLTPNGKVDRRALPAPERGAGEAYLAPRTPTEEVLAGMWAELLGTGRVGVEESFFELGGHSLLAMQVVSRARQAFGVEVPLRALFETPTVAALAGRIEALRSAGAVTVPPLERVPRTGPLPLSFAQQRLWLVHQLEPESPAYNMPSALRLRGALDPRAMRAGLHELARRHEALRTTFAERDGAPVQVVHPAAPVPLALVDLRALPAAEREAEAGRLGEAEALRPFDLARGPLLRALLVRLGEDDHVLCFTLHHAVGDGWSMDVLVREVSALYTAFSRGEASPLPELPVQYADFTVWQRSWLSGDVLEAQLAYWRDRLAGAPALLELPTERPRPPVHEGRGDLVDFDLPPETTRALASLARREGATTFMALLAAWSALLARWSGQDDVVVGSPIAGRTRAEVEGLIGFFANTLVLRTDLSGSPTFRDLLARVRETTLGAYQHQDLPFERLVEELAPQRSLSHTPLFQVLLVLQNTGPADLRLGPLEAHPLDSEFSIAKFDLTFALAEREDRLAGALSYRTALWGRAAVERMLGHFGALLEAAVADPDRRVHEMDLLPAAEREQVLRAWNATDAAYPLEGGLAALFEGQAARTPDATALVFRDRSLTYAGLDRESARLAARLRDLGAGSDARVGLCVERGLEMVVGLLAILRAGAAYVPLDPAYPAERLEYMLEDAGCGTLLTLDALRPRLPGFAGSVVLLDAPVADAAPAPRAPGSSRAPSPDGLAYVIYTSGSTGRPKGVAMTQRPLLNLLSWQLRQWGGRPAARTLQFASISFDVSFQEIFSTLATGGTLVLVPGEARTDLAALARLAEEERIERIFLPFIALHHLAEAAVEQGIAPGSLREVVTAGEQLRVTEPIRRWLGAIPGCVLVNQYGPSETHVVSALALGGEPRSWPLLPSIGAPVANTQLYVLDRALAPAPLGVPGELFLGGDSLARGYLGRPELTAEKFVPDPYGRPGARLYRTGDRARWLGTGEVEFLGRVDQQVKVRGFRIEPGEVEAALEEHPGVREALVYVREDAPGERRLVGYVVAEEEVGAEELRGHLAGSLPEYMVPSAFVVLDAFPLTPSGKIDRRSLPAPDAAEAGAYVPPRTSTEEILAGIYAEVLRVERAGAGDDFFALGGHSLLGTRVVSRVHASLGVELPLRALFEAPTVERLAERVDELLAAGAGAQAPPLLPAPRDRPLPLSFAQQRLWIIDQLQPGSAAYNLPYAMRLRGALEFRAMHASLGALVRRHETLRTTIEERGGEPVQVIHPAAPAALPVVDLRRLPDGRRGREAERLTGMEALRPFDLARGPLLRSALLRLGDEEHVLCFTLHHVVSDGWSMDVLVREVSALYAALTRGEAARLPELPVQYADYAVAQRAHLSGERLEAQLDYWRTGLAGAPPLLELPTDRPRSVEQSSRTRGHSFVLDPEISDGLRSLSRREGATLFMTLLAGWQALLGRYSGQEDVVVGSPVAGRTRTELEGLIGFFVNTLVLRTDVGGDPALRGMVARAWETTLGAQ